MNTTGWTVLVLGIFIVLIVIGLIVATGRKRQQQAREDATELRAQSEEAALDARQREAEAASKQVEAEKTQIEADRLQREAQDMRDTADDHLRKANEIEPDFTSDDGGRGDDAFGPVGTQKPTPGDDRPAAEDPALGNTRRDRDPLDTARDPDNPRRDDIS